MKILSVEHAVFVLKGLARLQVEEFWVLALGPGKSILGRKALFRGTVDACLVHPRDIFRYAIEYNASCIILAHNHPSNDPAPSAHDVEITKRIIAAGTLLQIPVLDHIIITEKSFRSMARAQDCNFSGNHPSSGAQSGIFVE